MLKLLVGFLTDLIKNNISAISYVYISGSIIIIKIYQSGFIIICIHIEAVFRGTVSSSLQTVDVS